MKTKFLQIAVGVHLCAALLMLLPGCGGQSSDPLKKYKDVKGEPLTEGGPQSEDQKIIPDLFTVEMGESDQSRSGNLIEGKEGQILIKISPKSTKISNFTVSLLDFPLQDQPKIQVTSTPGIYALMWKPPMGIIPPGAQGTEVATKILVTPTEASDSRLIGVAGKPEKIVIFISRNNAQPKILNYTSLENGVDEGQKIPFSIEIEDPASATNPRTPEIQVTPFRYANTEAFVADGSSMLTQDTSKESIQKIGATRWKFNYILNAERFADDRDRKGNVDAQSSSVKVCFYIRAISVSNTGSVQPQVCFTGRYAAQAPTLTWEDQNLKEVKSGVESQIKFSIKSANGLGKTELKDTLKHISSLTGSKSVKCDPVVEQNKESQNCVLTWTPTCSRSAAVKKLTFKVENTVGEKIKSQSFEKELNILSNEELCPDKKAQPTSKGKGVTK
ncbi:MAG: hypothetical protein AABY64_03160 [Bdellovibrionota bacterium]